MTAVTQEAGNKKRLSAHIRALRRNSRGATQLGSHSPHTHDMRRLDNGYVSRRCLQCWTLSERPQEPIHTRHAYRILTAVGSLCRITGVLLFSLYGLITRIEYMNKTCLSIGILEQFCINPVHDSKIQLYYFIIGVIIRLTKIVKTIMISTNYHGLGR